MLYCSPLECHAHTLLDYAQAEPFDEEAQWYACFEGMF